VLCLFPDFECSKLNILFLELPRQLRKIQAFPELPRHFRKCLISANACDIYIYLFCFCFYSTPSVSFSSSLCVYISLLAPLCFSAIDTRETQFKTCFLLARSSKESDHYYIVAAIGIWVCIRRQLAYDVSWEISEIKLPFILAYT